MARRWSIRGRERETQLRLAALIASSSCSHSVICQLRVRTSLTAKSSRCGPRREACICSGRESGRRAPNLAGFKRSSLIASLASRPSHLPTRVTKLMWALNSKYGHGIVPAPTCQRGPVHGCRLQAISTMPPAKGRGLCRKSCADLC
ncbi:hypothetical protein BV20DRAFT_766510 [Pilatotrama ljubarskyi]|nr:hypothetical protein BV20DRAFT_766510 [Pilatotrama ljubarskyi]